MSKRILKKIKDQDDWITQWIALRWNRYTLWKAKRLADQKCLLDRCRVYVLPIAGHYVVTPSYEVKRANREVGKGGKKNILDLLNQSVYTVTFDSKNKTISREKELKILNSKTK